MLLCGAMNLRAVFLKLTSIPQGWLIVLNLQAQKKRHFQKKRPDALHMNALGSEYHKTQWKRKA